MCNVSRLSTTGRYMSPLPSFAGCTNRNELCSPPVLLTLGSLSVNILFPTFCLCPLKTCFRSSIPLSVSSKTTCLARLVQRDLRKGVFVCLQKLHATVTKIVSLYLLSFNLRQNHAEVHDLESSKFISNLPPAPTSSLQSPYHCLTAFELQ